MGRRATGLGLAGLTLLASVATPRAGAADEKVPPFRLAVIAPLSGPLAPAGEETLLGARYAASAAGGGRPVEVLPFDDHDDPAEAEKAYAAAVAAKAGGVIAGGSGRTVDSLAAKARKGRLPVLFVGAAGPSPALSWKDPASSSAPGPSTRPCDSPTPSSPPAAPVPPRWWSRTRRGGASSRRRSSATSATAGP